MDSTDDIITKRVPLLKGDNCYLQLYKFNISSVTVEAEESVSFIFTKYGKFESIPKEEYFREYVHGESKKIICSRSFTVYRDGLTRLRIWCSAACTLIIKGAKRKPYVPDPDLIAKLQKSEDSKKEYYKSFYTQHEGFVVLNIDKFTDIKYHPDDEEYVDRWMEWRKEADGLKGSAKAGICELTPRTDNFISGIIIDGDATKCELFSNFNTILSFKVKPGKNPMFLMMPWCNYCELKIRFDADVNYKFITGYIPDSIYDLRNTQVVTYQYSSKLTYIGGSIGFQSTYL